jgi:cobaltochelatase CobN
VAKHYVKLADGSRVNVVPQHGQLFVCALGCCCGDTTRDFVPVLTDLYHAEWERRRLRNKLHLTFTACLGPCSLRNVVLLHFHGQSIWFHSLDTELLIQAVYNYIEEMLKASRYLSPPPLLAEHVFTGFTEDISRPLNTLPAVS